MDTIQVQIRFSSDTPHGKFNDALYFDYSEFPNVSEETIETLKQERVDKWIYTLENPAADYEEE